MRSDLRTALAAAAAVAVVLASASIALANGDATPSDVTTTATPVPEPTATATPDPEPDPTPTPTSTATPTPTPDVPDAAFTVDDAQLTWGFNAESNRAAFAPGTFNFFSAGKIPDPGQGGVTLPEKDWKMRSGQVHLQKYLTSSKSWQDATWAGLKTDSDGTRLTTGSGANSNHRVVVDGGSGTVDPDARSATVRWKGSFTVLYYSGYSFFYVTDPTLTVRRGVGTLTATLSGFGSSMDDLTQWTQIKPVKDVVLADLGTVDLTKDLGFTALPRYRGVKVSVPAQQTPQSTAGDDWGSFPQSFVDYQTASGTGSYWYSSGGSADAHKVATPVGVSYAAGSPVKTETPPTENTHETVTNETIAPPTSSTRPPVVTAPSAPAVVGEAPDTDDVVATPELTQVRPLSTVLGARAAAESSATDTLPLWIAGSALLLLSALVASSPFAYAAVVRRR